MFPLPTLDDVIIDARTADVVNYLLTCSGFEVVRMMQFLRDPSAQAALTTALLAMPPAMPSAMPPAVPSRAPTPEKAKKVLNGFVGFRCYYIVIPNFKPWPMKALSGPMGTLWDSDPNKALWSLMTKAWSTIRDKIGNDNAPLGQFFRIICPYLNIPSPEIYFQQLGWNFYIDENDAPAVSRDLSHTLSLSDTGVAAAALSVEDIIDYCQAQGYAQLYISDQDLATSRFSTFLGHINSERLAEKQRLQARREVARETGFTAHLHEQILHAHILGGYKPGKDNEGYHLGSERDTAETGDQSASRQGANTGATPSGSSN